MGASLKLGAILVEQGLISAVSAERVAATAGKLGKRFGVVLEEMGLVTQEELAQALALQYGLRPLYHFAKASFPPELLALLPVEVALANTLFPLKLDGKRLALATADPTCTKVTENLAANQGVSVTLYVSTPREIKSAICRHYLGKESLEPARKTVLIVEDDKAILALLREALSREYQVVTAADGLDAYKEVISKRPHVVLTDQEMPKLSGYALLAALRAVPETKQIPLILISGSSSPTAEAEAFDRGFFDFIRKPVKESTLLTRVKRAYDFSQQQNYLFLR